MSKTVSYSVVLGGESEIIGLVVVFDVFSLNLASLVNGRKKFENCPKFRSFWSISTIVVTWTTRNRS